MNTLISTIYGFINKHAKFMELVGILGTLAIISYQSSQMNLNLEEMRKNYSLDVNKMIHEHKQRINNMLIEDQNEELRKVFNLDKEKVMYYILINDYSNLFLLRKQGLVKDDAWEEVQSMMVGQLAHIKNLYDFWGKNKKFFNPKFVKFIDPEIDKSRPESFGIISKNE